MKFFYFVGTSLEVFKKWAPDEKNMVVIPGYCVAGTVGAKILAGAKTVSLISLRSMK
jgi:integrator complex subunit 11